MKCPVCEDVNLSMTNRQNIEIDYCPKCRGIWLDRDELDRLIDQADRPGGEVRRDHDRESRHQDYSHERYPKGKGRKSLLGELFDF